MIALCTHVDIQASNFGSFAAYLSLSLAASYSVRTWKRNDQRPGFAKCLLWDVQRPTTVLRCEDSRSATSHGWTRARTPVYLRRFQTIFTSNLVRDPRDGDRAARLDDAARNAGAQHGKDCCAARSRDLLKLRCSNAT